MLLNADRRLYRLGRHGRREETRTTPQRRRHSTVPRPARRGRARIERRPDRLDFPCRPLRVRSKPGHGAMGLIHRNPRNRAKSPSVE
jgi:hypothetical protein